MTLISGAVIYSNSIITPARCTQSLEVGTPLTPETCAAVGGQYIESSGGTVVSWPVTISFYNLPLDQSLLSGKSYAGRVEVSNVYC